MDPIEKRDVYKIWEYKGRKWRINKFDAWTGGYVAYQLMGKSLPFGMASQIGVNLPQNNSLMSKSEFFQLQRDCISVVEEILPSGPLPVLDDRGLFAAQGLEQDAPLVMMLTVQVLAWNMIGFFDVDLLSSLADALRSMKLPIAQMSASSSSPQ